MPIPSINLAQKLKDILKSVEDLPPEASTPLAHYKWSGADLWSLLQYVELNSSQLTALKPAVMQRHLSRLYRMILVDLIETFERFLKEAAAACIDLLGRFILDNRFDKFTVKGSILAVHFGTDTLGRALCESSTWLDTDSVTTRFKSLLADPFEEEGKFVLFPKGKERSPDRERYETLELVWQLRHTVVHNVGVITQSDAVKFRLMVKGVVDSPRLLVPTRDDIRYLKQFLDETAGTCNERIGQRVAEVLTSIHGRDPTLFTPQDLANQVTRSFSFPLVVAGSAGVLTPP
jgi:hypothetical protein